MIKLLLAVLAIGLATISFSSADTTDDKFQAECLKLSNQKRALHKDTPPLKTCPTLVKDAKERCQDQLKLHHLDHHKGKKAGDGENLHGRSGPTNVAKLSCSEAIEGWYKEIKQYNYKQPGFSKDAGHFTQMVWAKTSRIGCAKCGGKTEGYIVCEYKEPGNVQIEDQQGHIDQQKTKKNFEDNVKPLKK